MEQVFYLDLSEVTTSEELQELIKRELPMPEDYGMNLDAFYDILTEKGEGWNIIFYNTSEARVRLGRLFQALERLGREASEEVDGLKIRFF